MTLDEAKKSLDDLKAWVATMQPRHFLTNSDQDTTNITSLTEMQAGLTEVNTKIGNLLFRITEPPDKSNNSGPNDPNRAGTSATVKAGSVTKGVAPQREGAPPAPTTQPNNVS